MKYQTQVTIDLKDDRTLQNYVTSFNFDENITVSEFKLKIKDEVKFLDIFSVDKEVIYLGNKELKDKDVVPNNKSGLQYYLVLNKK